MKRRAYRRVVFRSDRSRVCRTRAVRRRCWISASVRSCSRTDASASPTRPSSATVCPTALLNIKPRLSIPVQTEHQVVQLRVEEREQDAHRFGGLLCHWAALGSSEVWWRRVTERT